jgi:uncharacterized damage-inducible protein DinB
MEILKKQYELIKGSRGAMLGFIGREVAMQFKTPLQEFYGSTVNYLLVHIINTYKHWGGNFAMKKGLHFADENTVKDINTIQKLFDEVDELMMEFLNSYDSSEVKVTNTLRSGKMIDISILELFTHMITHEFHHKGQIMTMCRLLGHLPPDTDVIRN